MKQSDSEITRAISCVTRYLKVRLRSQQEIVQYLERKQFLPDVSRQCLDVCQQRGWIDDHQFATAWINARLHKPLGVNRIRWELEQKGIDPVMIEALIVQLIDPKMERASIHFLLMQQQERVVDKPPDVRRRRLIRFLKYRGFTSEGIERAIQHYYDDSQ